MLLLCCYYCAGSLYILHIYHIYLRKLRRVTHTYFLCFKNLVNEKLLTERYILAVKNTLDNYTI